MGKGHVLGVITMQGAHPDAKKARRRPKPNATTLGENSVVGRHQQPSELAGDGRQPRPLTPAKEDRERVKNHARNAKVRATQDWMDGHMSTEDHERTHKRANHILAGKGIAEFRGRTGEKKGKKLAW